MYDGYSYKKSNLVGLYIEEFLDLFGECVTEDLYLKTSNEIIRKFNEGKDNVTGIYDLESRFYCSEKDGRLAIEYIYFK